MESLHLAYALVGTLAVVLALASRKMRDLPVSEPLLALVLGAVLGPVALGLISVPDDVRDLALLEGSRLVVALSVMAAALRFPASRLGSVARAVAVLLLVVMPVSAALSGAAALLLGFPLALAALVGACLAPTDPVLAGSIVSGEPAERTLPGRLRHMLSAESGLNDGLALPLVALAIAVVVPGGTLGEHVGRVAYEVLVAVVIGGVLGALGGWATRFATRHRDLEPAPDLVLTMLLAVAALGVARTAHTDGILAVFIAGTVYNLLVTGDEREPQEDTDEAVNRYLSLPVFFLLGLVLPWEDWGRLGPAAVLFVVAVLVVRRLPAVVALARPLGLDLRQAAFLGWFGPMGASSIFYVAHSIDKGVTDPRFFAAATLMIVASVVVFGVTSSPGRKLYGRSAAPEPARASG
ncbi:sodium/proton antiporter, CPA1 family [Georgenia satyanarayanai]|uniref:Sodium/proton antiporter, CPA1 family n=1 Tax=Georgenia satyanarayanai TaxID=860221 RepID=A0A2Y9AL16_9MICO|nr:cation:proton antiporter [Georgenia satyanarayanai]PYF98269.1 sodium/proton antiporter (CPA1 family) [Georgenia satyanarayanai]SSA45154.1 sodium/proton antiporter, CPA1 family [Georgenia satyanarayanai]